MRIQSGDAGQTAPMDDSHSVGRTSDPTANKAKMANTQYGVIQQSAQGTKGLGDWNITEEKGKYLRPNFHVPID